VSRSSLIEQAVVEGGQLVVRRHEERDHVRTKETNVSALFDPGKRTTNNIDILIAEAEQQARGDEVDNPAFPADVQLAQRATKKIVEKLGLTPAYSSAEPGVHPDVEAARRVALKDSGDQEAEADE
jgi:hypothetical protein